MRGGLRRMSGRVRGFAVRARSVGGWRRLPPRWRVVGAVAAGAVVLAGAGLVARDWVRTVDAAERVDRELAVERLALRDTEDHLASMVDSVDVSRATLLSERASLAARVDEREAAEGTANDAAIWLAGLKDQLASATADLDASSGRLSSLQVCLVGVSQALNQAAARDHAGLAATLREVEGSCSAAGVEL